MKNQIKVLFLLAGLSLCSCMKIVHTHQQVMQSFKNKESVLRQFGSPDEKREINGTTEWLYNCDSTSNFAASNTLVQRNGGYNSVSDSSNNHTATVTQFTQFTKYIKFTFDPQGDVLRYNSHGVNFAEKKKNPVGTVLLVVGLAASVATLVAAVSFHDAFSNWQPNLGY